VQVVPNFFSDVGLLVAKVYPVLLGNAADDARAMEGVLRSRTMRYSRSKYRKEHCFHLCLREHALVSTIAVRLIRGGGVELNVHLVRVLG